MKIKLLILIMGTLFISHQTWAEFSPNFFWCTATAAHQVEGNNQNSDWWKFEQQPGRIKNNERSGLAVNQWDLIDEDIQKMKEMGVNAYRFSVEWAKLQPAPGQWDETVLDHYIALVKSLKAAGIQPLLTLNHFTLPQWFEQKGGWISPESPELFTQFSVKVFEVFKNDVKYWVTFNEPLVLAYAGYIDGFFPPGVKGDFKSAFGVLTNVLKAHAQAVTAMRKIDTSHKAQFGFAHHLRVFDPIHWWNPLDQLIVYQTNHTWNWSFTEALATGRFQISMPFQASVDEVIPNLKGTQDFFGINYYTRDVMGFSFAPPFFKVQKSDDVERSDLGWEIYPEGLARLLKEVHAKYANLPILITENGIADSKDQYRSQYIHSHLSVIEEAIKTQIPIIGYCHWSLLDNFEWAEGFTPRFGLYEVEYPSLVRKPRKSLEVFKSIIRSNTTQTQK